MIGALVGSYLLSLAVVWRLRHTTTQITVLGFVDLAVIGMVASQDPVLWMAMLLPAAGAVSIGWVIGAWVTTALLGAGVISMGAAAYVVEVEGSLVILSSFALCMLGMNRTNLQVHASERANILRIADLVGSLPVIVWESDADTGVLIRAVGRVEALLGYRAVDWLALDEAERTYEGDLKARRSSLRAALRTGDPVINEYRMRRANGSLLPVREVVRMVEVEGRAFLRGVVLDVTEERAARGAIDRLAAVVDNQREPLVLVGPRRVGDPVLVIETNRAFDVLADRQPAEFGDVSLKELAPWIPPATIEDLDRVVRGLSVAPRCDVEASTPRGDRVFDIDLVALSDSSVAVQFMDVTDRRDAVALIRHQAFHDVLTGLPNRSLLFDRLSQSLARASREGSTVGLLLLDLNQFKEVNDTLGHACGDLLLGMIGERLATLVRGADTVARLGGDEFALIVPDANEGDLTEISARVADALKTPLELGGIEVEVTASVGGVIAPHHGDDPHLLLQRADVAMYEAKRSASGFRLYTADDDRHSVQRLALMGELRRLLEGELRVWYQPKVDLRTGRPTGFEALARWQHPRLGLLTPDKFIELCEVSGVIGDLTWKVLDEALAAAKGWRSDMSVAVNVPVRNLYDLNLPEGVMAMLRRHQIEPGRLVLEITEREIMEDHRAVISVLEELHECGVRISIDDFGTGFSSLSHLRRLPIHEIKIDQSFVAGMLINENDYIIARAIIDLAHNLGHRVVAEGIEEKRVVDLLEGLGCDAGQGYFFAKPAPLIEVTEWLAEAWPDRMAAHPARPRTPRPADPARPRLT